MRLHNLRDAGSLLPPWASAGLLNVLFLAMYVLAVIRYDAKPVSYVASSCTAAILLSLVLSICLLVYEVIAAKAGEVAQAISKGLVTGLNLTWATTCIALLAYIGWTPASNYVANSLGVVIVAGGAIAVVFIGYYIASPSSKSIEGVKESAGPAQSLALHPDFRASVPQRPAFQATIADLTRLITHQAGRAIGYAGSNVLFDDMFSLELDVNARVARVFSNMNLINTEDFMYWRLHMLMMGPAAEKILTGRSSEAALDDYTSFDDLAGRYLTLRQDRTFNAVPINMHEAAIKASRISLLRKNVYDRCIAACNDNRRVLADLVKLMRARSVLTYGDIRGHLEHVVMPEGFPVAHFDESEILHKALLSHDDHLEVTLEGAFSHSTAADASQDESSTAGEHEPDSTIEATSQAKAPSPTAQPANDDQGGLTSATA